MQTFKSDLLEVTIIKISEGHHELTVRFNNRQLKRFDDETIIINSKEAYTLTRYELEQIPVAIQIHSLSDLNSTAAEGPHLRTIVDYTNEGIVVAIIYFEPKDDFLSHQPIDEVIKVAKEQVILDKRLELNPFYLEEEVLDIDSQIELQNMEIPVSYSSVGPFEFNVTVAARTLGELVLELDKIMYELEEKVKLYF